MTLTSEKTATKRHAWLVGATTAAMAVALIGVGPIAANATPTGDGALAITTGIQSAPGDTTLATTTPINGSGTATPTITLKSGAVVAVAVTTPSTVSGVPAKDVTDQFTFTQGTDSAGDVTNDIEVAYAGSSTTDSGPYTLTLTPQGFGGAATSGSVSQTFSLTATTVAGTTTYQAYVGGSLAKGDAAPVALPVNAVEVDFGKVPTAPATTVSQVGSKTGSFTLTGGSTSTVTFLPAGASYTVSAAGEKPVLSWTSNTPFNGTQVASPASDQFLSTVAVTPTQNAPIKFGDVVLSKWAAPAVSPFNDVTTSTQFYNDMAWLSETGISTGYADGGFHPAATIKRNAEAAFLYRLAGSPTVTAGQKATAEAALSDIKGIQFENAIAWLYTSGITTGYSDGTFRPAAEVTRGAMAAFLYRFVNNDTTILTGGVVDTMDAAPSNYANGTFNDVSRITQFAGDIAWLANAGDFSAGTSITTGYADGGFHASASIKRNAMAAFLYRLSGGPVD